MNLAKKETTEFESFEFEGNPISPSDVRGLLKQCNIDQKGIVLQSKDDFYNKFLKIDNFKHKKIVGWEQ